MWLIEDNCVAEARLLGVTARGPISTWPADAANYDRRRGVAEMSAALVTIVMSLNHFVSGREK